mmetsp:Transcript_3052/g.5903  ORF Transcript_3052/g.5903 Transcript_3052/m.5903 type:complete len:155 (+) Transcript_3052:158-622(+)
MWRIWLVLATYCHLFARGKTSHVASFPSLAFEHARSMGGGGAREVQLTSTMTIDGKGLSCLLANTTVIGDGSFPLVSISNCSDLIVANMTFQHGVSAKQGGCLQLEDISHLLVSSSLFFDCHVWWEEGAFLSLLVLFILSKPSASRTSRFNIQV